MGMTMNEALVAGTLNAAASIGHSDMFGSLEVGKFGDMLILDAPQWEHLFYRIGHEPILKVIKKGVELELWSVCWEMSVDEGIVISDNENEIDEDHSIKVK